MKPIRLRQKSGRTSECDARFGDQQFKPSK
jgi:hypothetical protein